MVDFTSAYSNIRLTCPKGIAPYLKEEVQSLGYNVRRTDHTGVELKGTLEDCIHLNLKLRTCHKVLFLIERFKAKDPDTLYKVLVNVPWEKYLKSKGYFSIDNFVQNDFIQDTRFANLKAKDAIVDRLQNAEGKRPNSGAEKDKAVLFLYWMEDEGAIFLDTSGEPLSKHGYRKNSGVAPLAESLGAAIILASEWSASAPFVNPMCGTGTLAIEAALYALGRPPALMRDNFSFMHLKGYKNEYWNGIREKAKKQVKREIPAKIIATDNNPAELKAARENARQAGVLKFIEFKKCEFEDTPIPEEPGTILMNPPYGERLGEKGELENTYKEIGDFFKQQCKGYQGYVFTGNLELAKNIGLKPKCRIPFYNGKIECRLLGYDLY